MYSGILKLMSGLALMAIPVLAARAEEADRKISLDIAPAYAVLKSGEKQSVWVRVAVQGFEMSRPETRPPVNLAIVLDRSGSMHGDKIAKAREAAIDAVRLLNENDIVSVVTYESGVEVLVPATRLTDKEAVIKHIRGLQPGGNTALFAGVSKGVAEVRKFAEKGHVNRVILLSDGLANVGPSSPGELGSLGTSLKKENISVSTLGLGLGYNEDLMVQLAAQSGGNHHFIENASELADIFRREFDDVLSVVAQEVDIRISIPETLRPVRVLGNDADINGQQIVTRISQIYSKQTRYIVVELEIPATDSGATQQLSDVAVTYTNMQTKSGEQLQGKASVQFSDSASEVSSSINKTVMADVVALIASEKNKLATQLLDQGDLVGCRRILSDNSMYLKENGLLLESPKLDMFFQENFRQLKALEGAAAPSAPGAVSARKGMRFIQNAAEFQQEVRPAAPAAPDASGKP